MKPMIRFFRNAAALGVLLTLTITPSMSQVSLELGGGIGVLSPTSDLGGSSVDYYNGARYGLNTGTNVHGNVKVGLLGVNLAGEIDYSSLKNSGNSEPGQGTVDISQKILTLKVGPEYRLSIPLIPVTPYVGAYLALNRFTGETTFQGAAQVPTGTYTMNSATRLGGGCSAGTEVSIGPFLALDFNISYNLMNFAGREWVNVDSGSNQRINSYLSLNDVSDPQYAAGNNKHFISGQRNIQSILFTAGILFGL